MTERRTSEPDLSRRAFLSNGSKLAAAGGLAGLGACRDGSPERANTPDAVEQDPDAPQDPQSLDVEVPGKDGLRVLNDRPINAETPAHLLDDEVTPSNRMFVRNNGLHFPVDENDIDAWTLEIAGESCDRPQTFSVAELRERFEAVTLQLTIECAGNGRAEFSPRPSGNQWTTGAVACPEWTGVRVRDVLAECGVAEDAVYLAYEGADAHLSGRSDKQPISRGVPIAKALEPESLIAFEMNGEPLPVLHGRPLRLVTGGWPASTCGKWLRRLLIRDRVHDGAKMAAPSYRVPRYPVAPGTKVPDGDMMIIGSMPVKSLITAPESGTTQRVDASFEVRGHAWAGDLGVARVDLSTDFGATWIETELRAPANRLAWQHFRHSIRFDAPGYYELWARATDQEGRAQPMVLPGWNPKGYLNNACHRIAVRVEA
ncbi:MAG: sulfite oxidase [Planctomycetota bacterium]